MLTKKLSALVPRTVKRRIAIVGVVHQGLEKRRIERGDIIRRCRIDQLSVIKLLIICQL